MKKILLASLLSVVGLGLCALPSTAGLLRGRRCRCDYCPAYLCCCQPPGVFVPNAYVGASCAAPCYPHRPRWRHRRRCCCDLCGGCPSCLGTPSVFNPGFPTPPPPGHAEAFPSPTGTQQAGFNAVQPVGHEEPAPQYGGFVNPYAADLYAPNPHFANP